MTPISTKPPDPGGDTTTCSTDEPAPAKTLEWDDETPTCELWSRIRRLGLSLEILDRRPRLTTAR